MMDLRCNSGVAAKIVAFDQEITANLAKVAAGEWICCNDSHKFCWDCAVYKHWYKEWMAQPLFAFEERECSCCGHTEGRPLPIGKEDC